MRNHAFPRTVLATLLLCLAEGRAIGQTAPALAEFSLEQLSDIVVTSVSRQETRLASAPTSIFRITQTMIHRSGATTLAEALRLAPNLQVAQADARTYAITARGFSSTLENKLLVLIDGRSVYSPLFSGVFWDMQDLPLEDVDRIEVISGPGSTIWGANAVNGVINIITKAARETQDSVVAAAAGSGEHSAMVRHGGALGAAGFYRVYAKYDDADGFAPVGATPQNEGWHRRQAGFRADLDAHGTAVTVSGDAYHGQLGQRYAADLAIGGANLVARASRHLDDGSDLRVQAYIDHVQRDQAGQGMERLTTADLELQHDWRPNPVHTVAWGGGYRAARDHVTTPTTLQFLPNDADLYWANLFAQDEVALDPRWRLTVGSKAERTNYTGLEWLPSVRLAFQSEPNRLWWAALTRAVRAPARIDRDLYVLTPGQPANRPAYLLAGGPQFRSETARTAELGFRDQPQPELAWNLTAFATDYDDLRTLEPHAQGPLTFENRAAGHVRGLELWGRYDPAARLRLTGGLVWQQVRSALKPGSHDASGGSGLATNDPGHYWVLRALWDVADGVTASAFLRQVGSLPQPAVPSYHELDLHLGWMLTPHLELGLTGRNLLHAAHAEFGPAATRQLVERAVLLHLTARF